MEGSLGRQRAALFFGSILIVEEMTALDLPNAVIFDFCDLDDLKVEDDAIV